MSQRVKRWLRTGVTMATVVAAALVVLVAPASAADGAQTYMGRGPQAPPHMVHVVELSLVEEAADPSELEGSVDPVGSADPGAVAVEAEGVDRSDDV